MARAILTDLQRHIQDLIANPSSTKIDAKLFDKAELVLPDQLEQEDLYGLVKQLTLALQTIQQDPTALTSLLQAVLKPFTFSDVLSFDPPVDFVSGLSLDNHMRPINKLMLYLLGKATQATEVAYLANKPEVVRALVHLWMSVSDAGIGGQAGTLLCQLLEADALRLKAPDQILPDAGAGQGLLWKRLFTDRDVYGTIYDDCDLTTNTAGKTQASLAQARLLSVLPSWADLDWDAVTKSHIPEIEAAHGVTDGGLMAFAVAHMVDSEEDVLTASLLIGFACELLKTTENTQSTTFGVSKGLAFLITHGLHQRLMALYLGGNKASPWFDLLLGDYATKYVVTYARTCPEHVLSSGTSQHIKQHLDEKFDRSLQSWNHGDEVSRDLHVLVALPRVSIMPSNEGSGNWNDTVLSLLPSRTSNGDVLEALGKVFHGPSIRQLNSISQSAVTLHESGYARALYLHYLANNQTFWKDLVAHADTVVLADTALAALGAMTDIITANWSVRADATLPSHIIATPDVGHLAVLSPPALEYVLPYLMKPPRLFSNLVGGRGDAESLAYRVAMAKYDVTQHLYKRLAAQLEEQPDPAFQDILEALGRRLAEGPMSNAGDAGGRVATMEL